MARSSPINANCNLHILLLKTKNPIAHVIPKHPCNATNFTNIHKRRITIKFKDVQRGRGPPKNRIIGVRSMSLMSLFFVFFIVWSNFSLLYQHFLIWNFIISDYMFSLSISTSPRAPPFIFLIIFVSIHMTSLNCLPVCYVAWLFLWVIGHGRICYEYYDIINQK